MKALVLILLIPVLGKAQERQIMFGPKTSSIQGTIDSLLSAQNKQRDTLNMVRDTVSVIRASANTIKGTFSAVAGLLQGSYVVTHNAGFVPASVMTQPINQVSASLNWVSNVTSTTFTYNVIAPLAVGQTISFYWLVIKV